MVLLWRQLLVSKGDFYWKTRNPEALLWQEWEVDATIFDRTTGETHLLSPLPAEILRLLSVEPMTLPSLSRKLADACEVDCTVEWRARVERMLDELASLALVEKSSG